MIEIKELILEGDRPFEADFNALTADGWEPVSVITHVVHRWTGANMQRHDQLRAYFKRVRVETKALLQE